MGGGEDDDRDGPRIVSDGDFVHLFARFGKFGFRGEDHALKVDIVDPGHGHQRLNRVDHLVIAALIKGLTTFRLLPILEVLFHLGQKVGLALLLAFGPVVGYGILSVHVGIGFIIVIVIILVRGFVFLDGHKFLFLYIGGGFNRLFALGAFFRFLSLLFLDFFL